MKSLNKKNSILLAALLALVVVALVTGFTLAYLTDLFESDNDPATVGTVSVAFYNAQGTLLSGYVDQNEDYILGSPVTVTLSNTLNTPAGVDAYVKNTGNIPILVRVLIAVTVADENADNDGLLLSESDLTMTNTGWVNQFLFSGETAGQRTYYFYGYYNSKLAANASAQVIVSLSPKIADYLGETVSVALRADAVAYSANAYLQEDNGATIADADKPFGVLTTEFLALWTAWE